MNPPSSDNQNINNINLLVKLAFRIQRWNLQVIYKDHLWIHITQVVLTRYSAQPVQSNKYSNS